MATACNWSTFIRSEYRVSVRVMLRAKHLSPLTRIIAASVASHSRAAFSATTSSTGWMSVGELAMTPKHLSSSRSDAPGSRSSLALLSSLNNRTFSMAMTAWSAKVSSSLICFSVNGRTSSAANHNRADRNTLTQQRRGKQRTNARNLPASLGSGNSVSGLR